MPVAAAHSQPQDPPVFQRVLVGIAQMAVSSDPQDMLITYSLGSCIGITLYDPAARIAGMAHCMLPLSRQDPAKAAARPAMFTDTGFYTLLENMLDMGARKERIVAKAAGAAAPLGEHLMFKIGERNTAVLQRVLMLNNMRLSASDVGGAQARTLRLYVGTGIAVIQTGGAMEEL